MSDNLTNLQAEQGALGALMGSTKAHREIEGRLQAKHFADPINAIIFEAIERGFASGTTPDAITLKTILGGVGLLDQVGGVAYLAKLMTASPGWMMARPYADAVIDAWTRRELVALSNDLAAAVHGGQDLAGVLRTALAAIEDVSADTIGNGISGPKSLDEAVDAALLQADAVSSGTSKLGIMTGMPAVDAALGGLENGDMIVLGGRPGSGKSALAWKWAITLAQAGNGVLAISMEMTAAALGRRALSVLSGVPIWKMRRGEHGDDMEALLVARSALLNLPVTIEDGGRATAVEMMAMARRAQKKHGLRLVLIDHLQIAEPDANDARNGPTAGIAGITHAIKQMAKALNCPVILLSQLSRALESRDDKRPTMSDLRQAGAIEEDADMVLFVHRAETFLAKSPPDKREGESEEKHTNRVNDYHKIKEAMKGTAELIAAKVREGEPTSIALRFDGPTANFYDPKENRI